VAKTGSVTLKSAGRSMMSSRARMATSRVAPAVVERPGPVLSDAPPVDEDEESIARVADDDAGRHPRDAAGVHERVTRAEMADVRPPGEAVPQDAD